VIYIMGNVCCKTGTQYKLQIESVYPKNKDGEMGDCTKVTMYCLQNLEQLPVVGSRLEKRIRQDMAKHNINFVIIGCKILDAIILACGNDLTLYIINIVSIVKLLFEQEDYRLKIQATETLKRAVQHYQEQPFRQLLAFISNLIQMMNDNRPNQTESIALRIAGMRTISTMVAVIDLQSIDSIQKIISSVLLNMRGMYDEQVRPVDTNVEEIELSEFNTVNDAPQNLLDRNILQQLKREHIWYTARETLASISEANSLANVRIVMKPILDYLDQDGWQPESFVKGVFRVIMSSGSWAQQYVLALELIKHARDVNEVQYRKIILKTVSYVISNQNKKGAVSPRALETISALLNLLLTESDEMHSVIIEGIGTVARCGQHTSQNIDFMGAMLSALKKKDVPEERLLNAILVVSSYACHVQSGRFYPDPFIKNLLEESVSPSRPPRSRALLLAILQKLAKTQKYRSGNIQLIDEGENNSVQQTNNMVIASLSKKQLKDLHFCLYKSSLLKDNEPQNYVRIYRTLRTLLKQYRHKDIEDSVPMILTLQDACSNELDRVQCRAIHTLCAAYFLLLSQVYNSKELENYVMSIINARLESKQINKNFLRLTPKLNTTNTAQLNSSSNAISTDNVIITVDGSTNNALMIDRNQLKIQREDVYFNLGQIFTFDKNEDSFVEAENLFNKETIIELLNKNESLKSAMGETTMQQLSRVYTGDVNVPQTKPEPNDEPRWDIGFDDQTDQSVEITADVPVEDSRESIVDIQKADFVDLGMKAEKSSQQTNKALADILALVPASERDQDHSLISEIEEEEEEIVEGEEEGGEVHEMVGEKGKQKGRVMQNVPKLYLFEQL
jgi:hypothetical protein